MKLLIVDDQPDNLVVMAEVINQYLPELEILTAENVVDGLLLVQEHSFAGALIDVQMPGINGIEMCRKLKEKPSSASFPVILITAHDADSDIKVRGLNAGADDFLLKPIQNEELVARIKVILRIYQAEKELREANAKLHELLREKSGKLDESESRYRALVDSCTDHLYLITPQGEYLTSNNQVKHLGLRSGNELVGKSIEDVHLSDTADILYKQLDRVIQTGRPAVFEHAMYHSDGSPIHHIDTYYPVKRDGSLWAVGGICHDITEQKQIEQQLHHTSRMEAIGNLAGGIAHDFNNMLGVIIAYTELVLRKVDAHGSVHENLQQILRAAQKSADLTGQLLTFARKQNTHPQTVDLNQRLDSGLDMLKRLVGEQIEIELNLSTNPQLIRIDPSQLDQVLANLVVNARDAIASRGKIVITTESGIQDRPFAIDSQDFINDPYVLLRFTDNGSGIKADVLDHIFEPFYTTKEPGKGTGLGLSTIYGIVKQNNGIIKVKSVVDKGTTFLIYFPSVQGDALPKQPQTETLRSTGSNKTILVVEDLQEILESCRHMLESHGYRVLTTSDPQTAIDMCRDPDLNLDLLITDVIMPTMNGLELQKAITGQKPDVRVLFMSGYTADVLEEYNVKLDDVNYLQKPFNVNTLLTKIESTLSG